MTDHRFFGRADKNELYRKAGGCCEKCGKPLPDSWHADHFIPFSEGGKTSIENGQALCIVCNLQKGDRMPDNVDLRPVQRDLIDTVRARMAAVERVTVGLVSAGSGKTLAYQFASNEVFRDGLIDGIACYVPRQNLKKQAELDCEKLKTLCAPPFMGEIIGRGNIEPLVPADVFGYVATYHAAVTDSKNTEDKQLHLNWAKEHENRFLLILDEAQFLGIEDEDGGTAASNVMQQLAEYALHIIVLTATPVRSDGRGLVLCEYGEPNEKGIRPLKYHVRATYREGVTLKYLRPCEFILMNGNGVFTNAEKFDLETLEKRLTKVLRKTEIWQPLVDETINQFRICRSHNKDYRCLIAGIDQSHARDILGYVKKKYPDFLSVIAISDENNSREILDAFRPFDKGGSNSGDILVTVGMAYIGFDCPPITVVGNLTNRRFSGWMEQLIMRGGRMWGDHPIEGQTLIVVAPNDPAMAKFAKKFREDALAGLRDRDESPPPPPPPGPDDVEVETAQITDSIALGLSIDQDLTAEEKAGLQEFMKTLNGEVSLTTVGEIFRKAGKEIPKAGSRARANQKTRAERQRELSNDVQRKLSKLIEIKYQVKSRLEPELFRKHISRLQSELNKLQGVRDSNFLTEAQWEKRKIILDGWIGEGRRGE